MDSKLINKALLCFDPNLNDVHYDYSFRLNSYSYSLLQCFPSLVCIVYCAVLVQLLELVQLIIGISIMIIYGQRLCAPFFDYCDVVWSPSTAKLKCLFERIHSKFVKNFLFAHH